MRWRDDVAVNAAWFPRLLGWFALFLGLTNLADVLLTPATRSEQVLFGHMFTGARAQVATVIHVLFFVWAAWGCLTRKRFMPWVTMGYFAYVILSLWVWVYVFSDPGHPKAPLLVNAMCTVVLLAFCRVTYGRRTAFDQ